MSRQQYGEKFRPVQAYLHSGDCYQVNLAQRFQASYVGDEWQAFRQLNAVNRAPFSAFIRLDEGAILSLSPERFIQLRRGDPDAADKRHPAAARFAAGRCAAG